MINLTQHAATPDQRLAGVVDLTGADRARLIALLTADDMPSWDGITIRAAGIAQLAAGRESAMIGGAPWMMPSLHAALLDLRVRPCYAFSRRESVETVGADGAVTKTNIFRHAGFICAAA